VSATYDETVAAPAVSFDAAYFEKVSPDHFRESVWHMLRDEKPSMPHFRGQLSEANVRAIIEYLRSVTQTKASSQ